MNSMQMILWTSAGGISGSLLYTCMQKNKESLRKVHFEDDINVFKFFNKGLLAGAIIGFTRYYLGKPILFYIFNNK